MNKTKYNLFPFFEKLNNDWNYIQLKERFNNDTGFGINLEIKLKDGTRANVYSAGLWHILTNDEFANEGFITAYTKGFQNGKEFIENKTKKALNGFYSSCTNKYIGELHYAYFFKAENYISGYKNGACGVPTTFYIDSIENIGFASGIVFAIDLMVKESPVLFDGFYDEDPDQPQQNKPDEVYKTQNLFKVGLLFAMGKMNKYFTVTSQDKTIMKAGYSAPSIAIELKNNAYNKWILATINNYTNDNANGNKNIFNSRDMMTKIIDHCKAKKINVDPYFKSRLPAE